MTHGRRCGWTRPACLREPHRNSQRVQARCAGAEGPSRRNARAAFNEIGSPIRRPARIRPELGAGSRPRAPRTRRPLLVALLRPRSPRRIGRRQTRYPRLASYSILRSRTTSRASAHSWPPGSHASRFRVAACHASSRSSGAASRIATSKAVAASTATGTPEGFSTARRSRRNHSTASCSIDRSSVTVGTLLRVPEWDHCVHLRALLERHAVGPVARWRAMNWSLCRGGPSGE